MLRLVIATAICVFFGSDAFAERISEAAVEKACGNKIQGGCAGSKCATGCEKMENGTLYTYGCTFPNKTGATKATCSKSPITRTGQGKHQNKATGGMSRTLKAD